MAGIELKPLNDGNCGKNIPLPAGKTVIGRGPFLQVADKRVSRKHGLLEVFDGKLYLTPTHMNPCFFRESGSSEQITLVKDITRELDDGDSFSLLPDALNFEVVFSKKAQYNGGLNSEETKTKDDPKPQSEESGTKSNKSTNKESVPLTEPCEGKDGQSVETLPSKKDEPTSSSSKVSDKPKSSGTQKMASPIEKKRTLPNWMLDAAKGASVVVKKKKPVTKPTAPAKAKKRELSPAEEESEEEVIPKRKAKPSPPKAKPKADVSDEEKPKPKPKAKARDPSPSEEGESDEPKRNGKGRGKSKRAHSPSDDEESEEEYKPKGRARGRARRSPSQSEEDDSEEDYRPKSKRGRSKRSRSSDDDSDEDYDPRAKAKPKPRARPAAQRKQPTRSRRKRYQSEEESDDEDFTPTKRPARAAKAKRASYVDDLVVDDFSDMSDDEAKVKAKKAEEDSDFVVDEDDSGSDWAGDKKGSQKSSSKTRGRPQPGRRAARKTSRRKKKESSDEISEEEEEEEYNPQPSKRRGTTKEEDVPSKKTTAKHRKPCPFGKKCYRKNPGHFKEVAHPGDDSYDEGSEEEEEEDGSDEAGSASDGADKPECEFGTECYRKNAEHLKEYKHTKAPQKSCPKKPVERREKDAKSVLAGDSDDDGGPNTYDYDDSFISKTQPEAESEESTQEDPGDDASDFDPEEEEDVKDLVKEAKGFLKNKKMTKPAKAK